MANGDNDEGIVPLIKLAESYSDVADVKVEQANAPHVREEWLQKRRKGIGGSDAGAICGVDPYRTRLDVYLDKVEGVRVPDTPHMKRGRKLESLVAEEYNDRHTEDTLVSPSGILVHPDHQWMLANPDRVIVSPRKEGKGILEIKAPARPAFEKMKMRGVPPHYRLQMQHYLAVTGYQWGTFAIFNADSWELMLVDVDAWDEEKRQFLIEVEKSFWEQHVVPQVPPEVDDSKRIELPESEGIVKTVTSREFAEAVAAYESASEYAKEAEELKEIAKQDVIAAIHQEGGVYENDTHRVYYTKVGGRTSFDKKALARNTPVDALKLAMELAAMDSTPEMDALSDLLREGKLALDLSQFEKKGNDFMTLRVYPVKHEE